MCERYYAGLAFVNKNVAYNLIVQQSATEYKRFSNNVCISLVPKATVPTFEQSILEWY